MPFNLKILRSLIFIACINMIVFCSCSDMIEYSPYDANVKTSVFNTVRAENISLVAFDEDTLKFAVFSDSHNDYDKLSEIINKINLQKGLQFVVCCGDVTKAGLSQEYIWYLDAVEHCKYPIFTVIGNHDYRSNGYVIFNKVFGQPNMSFIVGRYKFVMFDDIIWENNNKSPKYEWLKEEMADSAYKHIVLAHIPPWSDQMEGLNKLVFDQIVTPQNTILCIYGHDHSFLDKKVNGIHSIVSGCVKDKSCFVVSIVHDKAIIEQLN